MRKKQQLNKYFTRDCKTNEKKSADEEQKKQKKVSYKIKQQVLFSRAQKKKHAAETEE